MLDLNSIVQKAQLKVQKKAAHAKEAMLHDKKLRATLIEENRLKREAATREKKQVSGLDMAEAFLQEIAEPFLRMMQRNDAKNLEGFRITLLPYKTDQGPFSMCIENPAAKKAKGRKFPNATIQQLAEKQGWQSERVIRKLEAQGGFNCSSQVEMLEEILRLREALQLSHARVQQLDSDDVENEASDG